METIHFYYQRPKVFAEYSVDDFGTEVIAVSHFDHVIGTKQIKVNEGTWWHLFRLNRKITEWRDGGTDE